MIARSPRPPDAARLERDDDCIGLLRQRPLRHSDRLKRAHSAFHQHAGEVGRTGEVIGDASQDGHGWLLTFEFGGEIRFG